jgi:LL-diaminopimelate aminotransferase
LGIYPFADHERVKRELAARGIEVIDLGRGDPDLAPPRHVIDALVQSAQDPSNHRYPPYEGLEELREAVAAWFGTRFGIELNPQDEVVVSIGAKEGLAHALWALLGIGDRVLVTDPGYPVPSNQATLIGAEPVCSTLRKETSFLPSVKDIRSDILRQVKVLCLNYPNNPTSAVAPLEFYQDVVGRARKYGFTVLNDAVYSEITFDEYRSPSILEVPGAKSCAVEFHSFSKTFNMAGWRIGFVVGSPSVLAALLKVKSVTDTSVFIPIQKAAIAALQGPQDCIRESCRVYAERRDLLVSALKDAGLRLEPPRGTFYLWAEVPPGWTSTAFSRYLLEQSGVLVSPGNAFGPGGEGYIRISLTAPTERVREAALRIGAATGGLPENPEHGGNSYP